MPPRVDDGSTSFTGAFKFALAAAAVHAAVLSGMLLFFLFLVPLAAGALYDISFDVTLPRTVGWVFRLSSAVRAHWKAALPLAGVFLAFDAFLYYVLRKLGGVTPSRVWAHGITSLLAIVMLLAVVSLVLPFALYGL